MKKATAFAAILAVTIMLSACKPSPTIPSQSVISEPVPQETTTESTSETTTLLSLDAINLCEPKGRTGEPNLVGNPDLDFPMKNWLYQSEDVETPWVSGMICCHGVDIMTTGVIYEPPIPFSNLVVMAQANPEAECGSEITCYVFEHNDDYAWNTDDAWLVFEAEYNESSEIGDYYHGKAKLGLMPYGVYTLVMVRPDGTVDSMYDFDIVSKEDAQNSSPVYKPVIYLYPEEETEVSVNIEFEGKIDCTYPQIDPENSWRIVADPEGHLYNIADGRYYDYLFWDGTTFHDIDFFDNAICVRGCDTAAFLEDYLEAAGLNSSEIDDFISFWLPMMQNNEYNLISFPTQEYEDMAKLNVSPAPDTVIRVYMVFAGVDEMVDIPSEQQLVMPENVCREGFTVVEWGGSPVEYQG